jgi:hypothetical protein
VTFVALGLTNVRRNLGRSALAVASMAIASLVVTSLLSIAPSAHQATYLAERFVLGGDIVLTSLQVITDAQALDASRVPAGSWTLSRPPWETAGPLREAVPWAWQYGYLAPAADPGSPGPLASATDASWASLAARLAAHPRIGSVHLARVLPVLEPEWGGSGWRLSYLCGRDAADDRRWWPGIDQELVAAGRYLAAGDAGNLVAVVDQGRQARGHADAPVGGQLRVMAPRLAAGGAALDFGQLTPVDLLVVGQISTWTSMGLDGGGFVPLYWSTGMIFVPEATLGQIVAAAGGAASPPVSALAVRAHDLVRLDSLVAELRRDYPELAVFAVQELVRATSLTGSTEPFLPVDGVASGFMLGQSLTPRVVPLNLNAVFALLALAIAALIVAANLLVLLAARRREMSILRAVGATNAGVATMVLTEAVFVSLAGCVLGFLPIRLLATITLVSNRLSLGRIAALTLTDFGIVCGVAMALAVVFGLLPAVAATRVTPTEALRSD